MAQHLITFIETMLACDGSNSHFLFSSTALATAFVPVHKQYLCVTLF